MNALGVLIEYSNMPKTCDCRTVIGILLSAIQHMNFVKQIIVVVAHSSDLSV
jgi:hypothetical protein